MKGAVLVLLCAIAVAHADINGFYSNGCPKDTSVEKLLPHENCDQYYHCFHGALVTRFCPSGLYFNFKLQKCDWTADVKCHEKREDDNKLPESAEELDNGNPSNAGLICSAADSNGLLVAHENCNEFYKCSFGKPIHVTCAENLLFNPVTEKCDLPYKVQCGERTTNMRDNRNINLAKKGGIFRGSRINPIVNENSDPSQASTLCAAQGSDGMLVAHENCNQFYKCFDGKTIALMCPTNLLYNPSMEYCDWPRNVICGDRIIPDIDDISDTENGGNVKESEENESSGSESDDDTGNSEPSQVDTICKSPSSEGVLIVHENCNQFYKCSDGRPVTFNCPGVLVYNPIMKYCDWAKNVDCGDRIKPDINNSEPDTNQNDNDNNSPGEQIVGNHSDPSQSITICGAQDSDGVLVAHENCNYFYKCNDGLPVALKCPGNLLYNPSKDYCDWPTNVQCGDRIIPEHDNDENSNENVIDNSSTENGSGNNHNTPSGAPAICAAEKSDGLLIAHENCNQFYKCFEGKPIVLFCQLSLLYNPSKEYCDWPHNVDCGTRLVPVHDNKTSDEISNNVVATLCSNSPDGDIVPHENCSQFYKCLGGQTYPMDCPPGLYYNDINKVCDWSINVKCGDRFTEEQVFNKHKIARRALSFL